MKKLFAIIAVTSIALFSSLAFAGGANCDSKKGHGNKDMSAEAWKEFKQNHAWIGSEDSTAAEKSAVPADEADKAAPEKAAAGLVES